MKEIFQLIVIAAVMMLGIWLVTDCGIRFPHHEYTLWILCR